MMASTDYNTRLAEAIALASGAHIGQRRSCGEPYILHPLRVMQACHDPAWRIAAVLHDVVEDTHLGLPDLSRVANDAELEQVDRLTRRDGEDYTAFVRRCSQNPVALEIKLLDIADNMDAKRLTTITDKAVRRLKKYTAARDYLLQARQGTPR